MTTAYYSQVRTDILAMIPTEARRIISLGCGEGQSEARLVAEGRYVLGLELHGPSASAARRNGLEVFEGDLDVAFPSLPASSFDCVICADILEHLRDPAVIFSRLCEGLRPGGHAIVSIPNFRNWAVFRQIFLAGEVVYTDAGIFDRTHLRITTRKTVERWFTTSGIRTDRIVWKISRRRSKLAAAATLGLLREFLASQVVMRGVKTPSSHPLQSDDEENVMHP